MIKIEKNNQNIKVVVFELLDEEYAIPVEYVGAIEKMQSITRVPDTPSYIKGVINLRGVIIPIMDLRRRFRMKEGVWNDSNRIIIVRYEDSEVGLIVDAANDVIDIPKYSIEPPPEVINSINVDYIEGVSKVNNRLFVLLKLEQVLDKQLNEVAGLEGS